jgi:hypothetical protein
MIGTTKKVAEGVEEGYPFILSNGSVEWQNKDRPYQFANFDGLMVTKNGGWTGSVIG